jgi:hypothetical protein
MAAMEYHKIMPEPCLGTAWLLFKAMPMLRIAWPELTRSGKECRKIVLKQRGGGEEPQSRDTAKRKVLWEGHTFMGMA